MTRKSAIAQTLVVVCIAIPILVVVLTTASNLSRRGIGFGLEFLYDRAGFTIAESILPYSPDDTNSWAIIVGIGNSIYASAVTIVGATLLGALLGIARLSDNPLVASLARIWIEVARNTPLLLLLLFLYTIWWTLPATTSYRLMPGVHISMRGLVVPWLTTASLIILVIFSAIAVVALSLANRMAQRQQRRTGRRPRFVALTVAGLAAALTVLTLTSQLHIKWPIADEQGWSGGITLTPETATILAGLIFYTTGYIAEIVRSGIEAIARGQWEAAGALGLSKRQTLRLVIIPQMMRVIVPPMTSQYINVVKNSTLAIAVGYTDFMVVMGTMINKTSHAIEGTVLIVAVYLVVNLGLSALLNRYNRRIALVER